MQQSEVKQWLSGVSYELAFWNNVYRWKSAYDGMFCWSRYGSTLQLEGMDIVAFLSQIDHPVVYDVGCGMSYAHGDHLPSADGNIKLDVHYIDPLAHFYNKIKYQYRRDVPDVEFGMLEYLTATVGADSAHLIIVQNALDHSANPVQGITEALCTLKVGGRLYLCHHPNEAEAEHYKGFHKYNITEEGGKFIIWNKNHRFVVDDLISACASVNTFRLENGFIVSVIEKRSDCIQANNQQSLQGLMDVVAEMMQLSRKPSFAMWQQMKYCWYNTIQFFVQALPWECRMKLRRLIYRK